MDNNLNYNNNGNKFKSQPPLLSIIVPCFNEINTIGKVIEKIKKSPIKEKEIIIIDDFSIDGSREFLKNLIDNQIITKFHNFKKKSITIMLLGNFLIYVNVMDALIFLKL